MIRDDESGYVSGESSHESLPEVVFSKAHLKFLNHQLAQLEPQDILRWCITSMPGLYQTTAFGLTGLVTVDMLSKLDGPLKSNIDLIFLDTLHHFQETLDLVERVRERYGTTIHVYKPRGCNTVADFEAKYGQKLWEVDDEKYDYVAKVEPAARANADLSVKALLTGRRRSQGGKRGDLDIIEVTDSGVIKINPLANWTFAQVKEYVDANEVPYNVLLDRGYKSVGDWHSTQPVAAGEDERAGRWKGKNKTECGIHNPQSRYAQFLAQQQQQQEAEELAQKLQKVTVGP
ncbi:phosphoadenosine phosphosulfate reductase [Bimuria novae-zelandiae CBS 107.79]|uniref:phosphoadenylyl-sulfate reductase (thioredoxin) n=1 Tax=Bimuria novae-zelandiae CBS 107.79 TaxID=1447943 RepID=A0A6A5ULB8_9PLEO|nr:phosphoadenosine phosphosulfate reductase [Bimuria novae-zelandiae CBS 107.79]